MKYILFFILFFNNYAFGSFEAQLADVFNIDKENIKIPYKEPYDGYFKELVSGAKKLKHLRKSEIGRKVSIEFDNNPTPAQTITFDNSTIHIAPHSASVNEMLILLSSQPDEEPSLRTYIKEKNDKKTKELYNNLPEEQAKMHQLLIKDICSYKNRKNKDLNDNKLQKIIKQNIASTLKLKENNLTNTIGSMPDGVFNTKSFLAIETRSDNILFITQTVNFSGVYNRTYIWKKTNDQILPVSQVVWNKHCYADQIITYKDDGNRLISRKVIDLGTNKETSIDLQPSYKKNSVCLDLVPTLSSQASQLNDIRVAIIDSGFNYTLPEFDQRILVGWDFAENDPHPFPQLDPFNDNDFTHGTAVASIYLQNKDLKIVPIKVQTDSKLENYEGKRYGKKELHGISNAIDFAVLRDAKIINLSIGDETGYNSHGFYKTVAQKAKQNPDRIFILGAGNTSQNLDSPLNIKAYIKKTRELSGLDNVFMVASVNKAGELSDFSSYGKNLVEFAAPGEDIEVLTSKGETTKTSGTSFATPNLGLAISHILNKNPHLTPKEVKNELLKQSTMHPSLIQRVKSSGYIDPKQILESMK